MTPAPFASPDLEAAVKALRDDLLAEGGPRISTMRNYRFAILPYPPSHEFALRQQIRQLSDELQRAGWNVLSISLHQLMLDRIKAEPRLVESTRLRERSLYDRGEKERAINLLKERFSSFVEGENGIAKDIIDQVQAFTDEHPEEADRTLILLGRAGALYPFFRSSALLKHLDGKTRNVPVVLLYPGERRDVTALSFMGELPADRDYRPRIYS